MKKQKRINSAVWNEKEQRWRITVQRNGERKVFTSAVHGKAGQIEANAKADAWINSRTVTGKALKVHWTQYLDWAYPHPVGTPPSQGRKKAENYGENYIVPYLGALNIGEVDSGSIQTMLYNAFAKGSAKKDKKQRRPQQLPLSKKTLIGLRSETLKFMRYCRNVIHVSDFEEADEVTIPAGARYKGKEILQPDDLTQLFSIDTTVVRGKRVFDNFIYAYRLQVSTGLRPGELIGLRVGDVDLKSGEIRVTRSINVDGEVTRGKNENAIRSFVLCDEARAACENQLFLLKMQKIAADADTPLFGIKSESAYYGRWQHYLKSNGLKPLSLYELRHTFVSIAKSLPEGQVKPIVGHSQDMDTFGVYGHYMNGEAQQTANAITGLFTNILDRKPAVN